MCYPGSLFALEVPDACDWFCGWAVTTSCHSVTAAKGRWSNSIFTRISVGCALRVEGNSAIPLQIRDYG